MPELKFGKHMTDLLDLLGGINESCTKLEGLSSVNKSEVAKIRMDLDIIYQKYAKRAAAEMDHADTRRQVVGGK